MDYYCLYVIVCNIWWKKCVYD